MKKSIILLALLLVSSTFIHAQTDKDFKKFAASIRKGKSEKVLALIKSGKNINAKDNFGETPLLYSLKLDKPDLAKLFIDAGADIKATDVKRSNSLHYAVEFCKSDEIVKSLVTKGVDINYPNSSGYTPFHLALLYKCPQIPSYFLENGANYQALTGIRENSLHLAARSGCTAMADFFIEKGLPFDNADDDGNTPLVFATASNHTDIAIKLINMGANVNTINKMNRNPLYYSIVNTDHDVFDLLLLKGAGIDLVVDNKPLILYAAEKEDVYMIQQLLVNGATNPMKCDIHDDCYKTALIYFSEAEIIVNQDEKLNLYQNSLNIYKVALEKYKNELNKIRAANTGKFCGSVCLAAFTGVVTTTDFNVERTTYLKNRIDLCNEKITQLNGIISGLTGGVKTN